jgi:hypothetical protein
VPLYDPGRGFGVIDMSGNAPLERIDTDGPACTGKQERGRTTVLLPHARRRSDRDHHRASPIDVILIS